MIFILTIIIICTFDMIMPERDSGIMSNEKSVSVVADGRIYKITKSSEKTILWIKESHFSLVENELEYDDAGNMLVYVNDEPDRYIVGNGISVNGTLFPITNATNDGGFDALSYYGNTYGVTYKIMADEVFITDNSCEVIKSNLYKLKTRLEESIDDVFDEQDAGIIKAMLYADKSMMDEDIKELFSDNGISHILAISGLHISIIAGLIFSLLRKFPISIKISTLFTIIFILLYAVMTDFSVSTNRAVIMMILLMVAKSIGRTYDMPTAIGISGIIILIQNPKLIYSSSFQMSFLAVVAVAVLYPAICIVFGYESDDGEHVRILKQNGIWNALHGIEPFVSYLWRNIQKSLLVSLSVMLVTLPVILSNYYEIQILSVFLNILIIPLMSVLVGASLLSSIIGLFWINGAYVCGGCVHYILKFIVWLCKIADSFTVCKVVTGAPDISKIILYYTVMCILVAAGLYIKNSKIPMKIIVAAGGIITVLIFVPQPDGKLHVDMLDVGQGDGICVTLPDGATMLVDGGSSSVSDIGKKVLVPYLKYHGKCKIEYVFISHMDDDHISGIMEIIDNDLFPIKCVVLPKAYQRQDNNGQSDKIDKTKSDMSKQDETGNDIKRKDIIERIRLKGIQVMYLTRGDKVTMSDTKIVVLNPSDDIIIEDENDLSQVFKLEYKNFSMLFTGDMGETMEENVIEYVNAHNIQLKCDILKVSHHGSKSSSCDVFLDDVRPGICLISAGYHNRYGHPSRQTLQRLGNIDSDVLVTMDTGQISVISDGENISTYTKHNGDIYGTNRQSY